MHSLLIWCAGFFYICDIMIKKIRFQIANELFGNKKLLKALAMLLFFYHKAAVNTVKDYNTHKLTKMLGISASTVNKRMATLREYGIAILEKDTLIFKSIVSKHRDRNISLEKINYSSLKDVEKSLYGILLVVIQSRKDYCRRTIRRAMNGKTFKEVKSARLILRRCGYGNEYKEFGLSYRRIARFFGCSIKSAFNYVRFALKQGMIEVKRNFQSFLLPSVNHREIEGYTFTTKNYGYIIGANIYNIK